MSNLLKEFTRSLRQGTGKAYLILQKHPALPVDDLLIDAALHNYDYDPQCSGSHAFQVGELLKLRPNYRELVLLIAERFATEFNFETREDVHWRHWDIVQLYDLLAHNCVTPRVTEIIHEHFAHMQHLGFAIGCDSIMETERLDGLCFVAGVIGASLRSDPDFEFDDILLFDINQSFAPDCNWRNILIDKSVDDVNIRTFLTALEDCERKEKERVKRPYQPVGMKKIMSLLKQKKKCHFPAVQLAESEQAKLRRIFMKETDFIKLDIICLALAKANGVTDAMIPKLIELARCPNKRIAHRVQMALGSLKSSKVREIAIKEIIENPAGWEFFELLEKNWQSGDEKFFLKWFNRLRSQHIRHSMIMSILEVKDAPPPLLKYLLNRTSCSSCREGLVRKLTEQNALDKKLCEELKHDVMRRIRETGEQYLNQ